MECLVAHVKANYPEADLSAPPAKAPAAAAAAPKAPAASPVPAKKEEVKKVNPNPFGKKVEEKKKEEPVPKVNANPFGAKQETKPNPFAKVEKKPDPPA